MQYLVCVIITKLNDEGKLMFYKRLYTHIIIGLEQTFLIITVTWHLPEAQPASYLTEYEIVIIF